MVLYDTCHVCADKGSRRGIWSVPVDVDHHHGSNPTRDPGHMIPGETELDN